MTESLQKPHKDTGAVSHGGQAVRLSDVKGSVGQSLVRKQDMPGGRKKLCEPESSLCQVQLGTIEEFSLSMPVALCSVPGTINK